MVDSRHWSGLCIPAAEPVTSRTHYPTESICHLERRSAWRPESKDLRLPFFDFQAGTTAFFPDSR